MKRNFIPTFLAAIVLIFACATTHRAQAVTDRYDDTFRKYSQRFFGPGFDWRIFKAQAMAESNISMEAKSWVGARGIMQLMPSTFAEIRSKNQEFTSISKPEWNIAAGIWYDHSLWTRWADLLDDTDHQRFTLASYNAGRGTLLRAQEVARIRPLDPMIWLNIETVAPEVPKWRHEETLAYVKKIEAFRVRMDEDGRVIK